MPITALVVDNNPVILKLLTHTLQQRGVKFRTAGDGLFALEVLDSFTPDIIFTDLIMPFIDGKSSAESYVVKNNSPKQSW